MDCFSRHTLAVNPEAFDSILSKFEINGIMVLIVTCINGEDRMKTLGDRVLTTLNIFSNTQ